MDEQQAYYSLLAFGIAILIGIVVVVFSVLFERRMRMHSRQNILNVLMNPCKLQLEELRKEVESLKRNKLDKPDTNIRSNGS